MIRYSLDVAGLQAEIQKADPKWFSKAKTRTTKIINQGAFSEKTSIWSATKPAFMVLQCNKCVFCERPFSGPDESRIEMDLEHFRPKGAIADWTPPAGQRPYPSNLGALSSKGYYWLAYDIGNYAAACKICNSDHKGARFPIAGPRCDAPDDPAALKSELSYLLYPIGDGDDDPEDIITFTGTIARPAATDSHKNARGALIIDFFGLNSRDQLHIQRAEIIERFGHALKAVADGTDIPADRTYVAQIRNPTIPHAACLRAFKRLWDSDQQSARRILQACRDMLSARLLDPTVKGLGIGIP
jgi:hypothetical protein